MLQHRDPHISIYPNYWLDFKSETSIIDHMNPDEDETFNERFKDIDTLFAHKLREQSYQTAAIRERLDMMRDIVLLAETNPTINDLLCQVEEAYLLLK